MNAQDFKNFETKKELVDWLIRTGRIQRRSEAEKWMRKNIPPESKYQKAIKDYLSELGYRCCCWKVHEGGYMKSGIPDINAVICGEFWAFEVKRPFLGVVSPAQRQMMDRINAAGGHAEVVSYVEEVEQLLMPLLRKEGIYGRDKEHTAGSEQPSV